MSVLRDRGAGRVRNSLVLRYIADVAESPGVMSLCRMLIQGLRCLSDAQFPRIRRFRSLATARGVQGTGWPETSQSWLVLAKRQKTRRRGFQNSSGNDA